MVQGFHLFYLLISYPRARRTCEVTNYFLILKKHENNFRDVHESSLKYDELCEDVSCLTADCEL